jgi:hypothetical protein
VGRGRLGGNGTIRTGHADLPLKLEVAFVCDDNDGERVLVLRVQNLLVERDDFVERVPRRDRVDEQEPFTGLHVLLAHGTASGGRIERKRDKTPCHGDSLTRSE